MTNRCDTCGYEGAHLMPGFRCPVMTCDGRIVKDTEQDDVAATTEGQASDA